MKNDSFLKLASVFNGHQGVTPPAETDTKMVTAKPMGGVM